MHIYVGSCSMRIIGSRNREGLSAHGSGCSGVSMREADNGKARSKKNHDRAVSVYLLGIQGIGVAAWDVATPQSVAAVSAFEKLGFGSQPWIWQAGL